jgi:hypothetical protein
MQCHSHVSFFCLDCQLCQCQLCCKSHTGTWEFLHAFPLSNGGVYFIPAFSMMMMIAVVVMLGPAPSL